MIPHTNWRGMVDRATTAFGRKMPCQNPLDCPVIRFPAATYKAYNQDADLVERQSWYGSLIEEKSDDSGLMYMRNRYYNPATGSFTQEDPIGIAGGLNTYGFAGGDPATYSDPYGLCPDSLRIANNRCPGNLSEGQYNTLENGARNHMRPAAGALYLRMLENGEFRLVSRTGNGDPAGADYHNNVVLVTEELFQGRTDGEIAFMGLHEIGHLIQWTEKMLVSAIGKGVSPNRDFIMRLFSAGRNTPEHALLQDDANKFACSQATAPGSYGFWCQ